MNYFDSFDKNVLKTHNVEDLRAELNFCLLPHNGLKDEFVDILLRNNENVITNDIQQNLIAALCRCT